MLISGLVSACAFVGAARAANITYSINNFPGGPSTTGTITTDGTIGAISSTDILSWTFTTQGITASSCDAGAFMNFGGVFLTTATDFSIDGQTAPSYLELAVNNGGFFGKKLGWYAVSNSSNPNFSSTQIDFRGRNVSPSQQFNAALSGSSNFKIASVSSIISSAAVPLPASVWSGTAFLWAAGLTRVTRRR